MTTQPRNSNSTCINRINILLGKNSLLQSTKSQPAKTMPWRWRINSIKYTDWFLESFFISLLWVTRVVSKTWCRLQHDRHHTCCVKCGVEKVAIQMEMIILLGCSLSALKTHLSYIFFVALRFCFSFCKRLVLFSMCYWNDSLI